MAVLAGAVLCLGLLLCFDRVAEGKEAKTDPPRYTSREKT